MEVPVLSRIFATFVRFVTAHLAFSVIFSGVSKFLDIYDAYDLKMVQVRGVQADMKQKVRTAPTRSRGSPSSWLSSPRSSSILDKQSTTLLITNDIATVNIQQSHSSRPQRTGCQHSIDGTNSLLTKTPYLSEGSRSPSALRMVHTFTWCRASVASSSSSSYEKMEEVKPR